MGRQPAGAGPSTAITPPSRPKRSLAVSSSRRARSALLRASSRSTTPAWHWAWAAKLARAVASSCRRALLSRWWAAAWRARAAGPNSTTLAALMRRPRSDRSSASSRIRAGWALRKARTVAPVRLGRAAFGRVRSRLRSRRPRYQRIDCPVLAQSLMNCSRPFSVNGCLKRARKTAGGRVAQSAPARATALTCSTERIEAARISVSNP